MTIRGSFRINAEYLRRKAFNRINILKALSQTRYGPRSYHLLTLAIFSIRSMIEYGAAVLNTANESIFKKIKVLQTTAIRSALGTAKCFPSIILRKYAVIPTLADRVSAQALVFWINHSS